MLFLIINSKVVTTCDTGNFLYIEDALGYVLVDGGYPVDDNGNVERMDGNKKAFLCNSSIVELLKEGDTVNIMNPETNALFIIGLEDIDINELMEP